MRQTVDGAPMSDKILHDLFHGGGNKWKQKDCTPPPTDKAKAVETVTTKAVGKPTQTEAVEVIPLPTMKGE